jgi:predicted transcriptional regulator
MSFPAILAALSDPRLQHRDLHVYHVAILELDLQDWRPFKLAFVARKARCRHPQASRALKRLCQAGYLERETTPRDDPNPRRYRLRYSPHPLPSQSTPDAA